MIGAIAGDIIGSRFEGARRHPITKNFLLFNKKSRFTDDTVLTCAVADALMYDKCYSETIRDYYLEYPNRGYGGSFKKWALSEKTEGYNSWGNGSAMRVSPVAFYCNSVEEVLEEAKKTADVTHNHEEGVKGAQAIALATYLAWNGKSKQEIKEAVESFGYRADIVLTSEHLGFDCSCQETVPQAVHAFLYADDIESAIRDGIMMGGDSDTIASMAGSIAHAYYKDIPDEFVKECFVRMPDELIDIVCKFMVHHVDKDFMTHESECNI
jgi:ADP-ribosylglycohydrolase